MSLDSFRMSSHFLQHVLWINAVLAWLLMVGFDVAITVLWTEPCKAYRRGLPLISHFQILLCPPIHLIRLRYNPQKRKPQTLLAIALADLQISNPSEQQSCLEWKLKQSGNSVMCFGDMRPSICLFQCHIISIEEEQMMDGIKEARLCSFPSNAISFGWQQLFKSSALFFLRLSSPFNPKYPELNLLAI